MSSRPSAHRRGLGRKHQAVRLIVLERDGYVCQWCGGPATEADHLVPRAEGGQSEPENMVASCKRCNSIRGGQLGARRRRRRRVHPFFSTERARTASRSVFPPHPVGSPVMVIEQMFG